MMKNGGLRKVNVRNVGQKKISKLNTSVLYFFIFFFSEISQAFRKKWV